MSEVDRLQVVVTGTTAELRAQLKEATASVGKLDGALRDMQVQSARTGEVAAASNTKAAKAAKANTAETAGMAAATGRATRAVQEHEKAHVGLGQRIQQSGQHIGAFGRNLSALSLPIGIVGGASVKMAADFNAAMEMVHTQAGASQREVDGLKGKVLELAGPLRTTPQELAQGLFFIESAGFRGAKALNILKIAAEGAQVGMTDMHGVANALTSVLNSQIKGVQGAEDAMAQLNDIVGQGKMHMGDLVGAISTGVLPAARTMGLTLRDVGGALDVMTRQGVPAQEAATRLRMTFALMEAPTAKATKAFKSIGLSSTDLANDMRKPNGLLVAVTDLHTHLEKSGLSATKQAQVLEHAFGGGRTSGAIMTLVQNTGQLRDITDSLGKPGGIQRFREAWKVTAEDAKRRGEELKAHLEALGVKIGQDLLPVLERMATDVGHAVDWFEKLPSGTRHAIEAFSAMLAVVGPLAIALGAVTRGVGSVLQAGGGLARILTGRSGGGIAGGLLSARGSTPANPMWVAVVGGAGGGGGLLKTAERDAEKGIGGGLAGGTAARLGMGALRLGPLGIGVGAMVGIGLAQRGADPVGDSVKRLKDQAKSAADAKKSIDAYAGSAQHARDVTGNAGRAGAVAWTAIKNSTAQVRAEAKRLVDDKALSQWKMDLAGLELAGLNNMKAIRAEMHRLDLDAQTAFGKGSQAAKDAMGRNIGAMIAQLKVNMADGTTSVKVGMQAIESLTKTNTGAARNIIAANFAAAANAIRSQMATGAVSVKQGTDEINRLLIAAFRQMGLNSGQAVQFARLHIDPGTAARFLSGGVNAADTAGILHGNVRATGGYVGSPGEAGRDEVPIVVGRGEAVLNRHQQPVVNAGLRAIGVSGGLPSLFRRMDRPHYLARGGFAGGGIAGHATAYGPPWGGIEGGGSTASGIDLHRSPHLLILAAPPGYGFGQRYNVNPNPFGTNLPFSVQDRGGAIQGDHFDIYDWMGRSHQNAWGDRHVTLTPAGSGPPLTLEGAVAAMGAAGVSAPNIRRVMMRKGLGALTALGQVALDKTRAAAQAIVAQVAAQRGGGAAGGVSGEQFGTGDVSMYAFPLPDFASQGRIDRGQDMEASHGFATTVALGPGIVTGTNIGFPGVTYRLTQGPAAGSEVFHGHNAANLVRSGQTVAAGQPVGHTGGPPGGSPTHTEIGFTVSSRAIDQNVGPSHYSPTGQHMHDLLHHLAPNRIHARGGFAGLMRAAAGFQAPGAAPTVSPSTDPGRRPRRPAHRFNAIFRNNLLPDVTALKKDADNDISLLDAIYSSLGSIDNLGHAQLTPSDAAILHGQGADYPAGSSVHDDEINNRWRKLSALFGERTLLTDALAGTGGKRKIVSWRKVKGKRVPIYGTVKGPAINAAVAERQARIAAITRYVNHEVARVGQLNRDLDRMRSHSLRERVAGAYDSDARRGRHQGRLSSIQNLEAVEQATPTKHRAERAAIHRRIAALRAEDAADRAPSGKLTTAKEAVIRDRYKTELKHLEDDVAYYGGSRTKLGRGGLLQTIRDDLGKYTQAQADFGDAIRQLTTTDIPGVQLELEQLGKPQDAAQADAGTPADDSAKAGLLQQLLTQTQQSLAVSEAQGAVYRGFQPLLAGRLQGTFAQGTPPGGAYIPSDGYIQVHRGERHFVDPDPKGGYGRAMSTSGPAQVTVYIEGDQGALTKRIRAEVDGRAAAVVSKQLGRRSRLIAGAAG